MYDGQRILAVVPARGGSKGVPKKNIQPIQGVPIVARVGHLIQQLPEIDRAVVSTDDPVIAETAEQSGLAAPWMRPESLPWPNTVSEPSRPWAAPTNVVIRS